MIGIIDYEAGNSHSVKNACDKIGVNSKYIVSSEDFSDVTGIILPGVGSSKATMESLKKLDIISALEEYVLKRKVPFLGICVGLQILFEHSEEDDVDCLGWLKGQVVKYDNTKVKVPQIGWNKLICKKNSAFLNGIDKSPYFYFVNSYYAQPANEEDIISTADYNGEFCAMIQHDNIYASQCHIEKSGEIGLQILKNFCEEVVVNANK